MQPDAGDKIADALAAAGVEVEYVVNNAGFGMFGRAIERDRADQLDMIDGQRPHPDRSVAAVLRQLIRHRGGMLNVGSIAGFLPGPGMAVYYASKAYVLSFTEALRAELAPHGVRVTALCPGPGTVGIPGAGRVSCPGSIPVILNVTAGGCRAGRAIAG